MTTVDYRKLLTSGWVVSGAILSAIAALVLNAPDFFRSLRETPNEIGLTSSEFTSWLYEDKSWAGAWTDTQEGFIGETDRTSTGMVIELEVEHGSLEGSISYEGICNVMPIWDTLMLSGEVSFWGKSATVMAWDHVMGEKKNIVMLRLEREDEVMIVTPVEGNTQYFPKEARIIPMLPEPDSESSTTGQLCPKFKEFIRRQSEQQQQQN